MLWVVSKLNIYKALIRMFQVLFMASSDCSFPKTVLYISVN